MTGNDFDPEAFIRQLDEATRRAQAIAALRPSRLVLSEKLLLYVDLVDMQLKKAATQSAHDELLRLAEAVPIDLERIKAVADRIPWIPMADSRSRSERYELVQLGWAEQHLIADEDVAFDRVLFFARRLVSATTEHLRAIGLLLAHETPVRSPLALGRVALESGARAATLLGPALTAQQRIASALNIEISAVFQDWLATNKTRDPGRRGTLDKEMQRLASIGTRYAIPRSTDNRRFLDPLVTTGQTIEEVLADSGPTLHHDLSAVIHSQESDFQRAVFGLDLDHVPYNQTQQLALAILPAILALASCLERLRVFCGWIYDGDYEDAVGIFLNIWSIASGLADERLGAVVDAAE